MIVGGMLLGTLFSLLVIPVLYRQLRRLVPVSRPLQG